MAEQGNGGSNVVLPLSLTDLGKALRELIGAFRDVAGLADEVTKVATRRRAGQVASNLGTLAFHADGFCKPLRQIADGHGCEADIDKLQQMLDGSADDVQKRVDALYAYREFVQRNCGAAACLQMINILDGPEGKFQIRYDIMSLIHMARFGSSVEEQKSCAGKILASTSKFNDEYVKLHDLIFPPRGTPK